MTLINGHLNQLLTNYALGTATNKSNEMIGSAVAPPITVPNQSDGYAVFDASDLRLDDSYYASRAQVNRVVSTESDDSFSCKEFALEEQIPWSKMANADAVFQLEKMKTAKLVNRLVLRREKAVADILFATGTFTHTAALSGADRWDVDTSSPVKKVADAITAVRSYCGLEPNAAVMGAAVWDALKLHPDITQRVAGLVAGTPATYAQAAAALGVDRILVGKAIYNTAAEGAAASYSQVWGKFVSVCYIDPSSGPGIDGVITPMQQFVWSGVSAPFSTFTYEEESSRSHVVQVYEAVDTKAIAISTAYLYSTVVS
jgi:hypothetical protein